MNIIVVGLSHKTAPVELRERLAIPESRMGEALARLLAYPSIKEGMFLSTCNRVEVYAVVKDMDDGFSQIQDFLVSTHFSLSADELFPHVYRYADESTIKHLFRVTSSLDSMVIGEPQILGQVKDAYEQTLAHRTSGVILNKFVKKAISVGKGVRTQTKIAEYAVSVSYAGVELAKKIFSSLQDQTVLLVGAGEMGKLAARHLVNSGVKQMMVTTRNTHRAVNLAEQFNGTVIPFEDFRAALPKADIVLCATGAPYYVITAEDIHWAIRQRMNRPMFLIDISVPRNIDPSGKDIDNAFVFDIDDLKTHVGQNQDERRKEADKAEGLVKAEVEVMLSWLRGLEATPTIVALRKRAEEIKRAEVEKVLSRLEHVSPKEQHAIEGLASAIVNKLLHGSLVTLKSEAQSKNGFVFIEAARRFFDLTEAEMHQGHPGRDIGQNAMAHKHEENEPLSSSNQGSQAECEEKGKPQDYEV
ncbi:MAG: glutamyl-tRNA reductase [Nitrospirales bacterium]|nr:MAG: glutamyl-tRNA reductase [Nitrospirales bacterium]